MRRHHTGSGRRTAVPEDWADTFGGIVSTQWHTEATVQLRKPGGTTQWNEATGKTDFVPFPPFAGNVPARITPITAQQVNVVEEQAWVLGYRVEITKDLGVTDAQLDEGIEIFVQTCSDPMLRGVTMRASEVVRGVQRFERVFTAQVNS
jgi:hypothetical protein